MRGTFTLSGRLLLAALLLLPCISKLNQVNDSIWTLRDLGVPYAWIIAPGITLLELVLGFCIAIGLQLRLAIPAIVLFSLLNGMVYRDLLLRDEALLQGKAAISSWLTTSADRFRMVSFIKP
jgi:uncharacterized membrane protein YphA (DoxX/SURF4 family)